MISKKFSGAIGWYGAFAIISAYFLVSFSLIKSDDILYQLLNLTGAVGLIAETVSKKDYQPAAVNIAWALIAVSALIKIVF